MTGAQILDAILADSFESSKRAEALTWANDTLAWIWNADPAWTFRQGTDTVTVTANSYTVSGLATDFGTALSLQRSNGDWLTPVTYTDFSARWMGTDFDDTGIPEVWCGLDSSLFVGPKSSETDTGYLLVYEKRLTLLTDGSTAAPIPAESHLALVFGGKSRGYALADAERSDYFDVLAARTVEALKPTYLRLPHALPSRWPADCW